MQFGRFSEESLVGRVGQDRVRLFVAGILAYLLADFAIGQFGVSSVNGLWLDELFSLVYSDPALTLGGVTPGIVRDTTPPLHMYSLWLTRHVVADPRLAFIALNLVAAAAALAALLRFRRSIEMRWIVTIFAAFLASGESIYFLQEGRPYFMACALTLVGAVLAADRIGGRTGPAEWALFATVGVLAGLTHLYASVALGGLAFSLCAIGVLRNRRDLLVDGLALGVSTSLVSIGWSAWAMTFVDRIRWLTFDLDVVRGSLSMWALVTFGSVPAVLVGALALLAAAVWTPTRRETVAIGVAMALFFVLPMIVSFVQPIIASRYFLIGAPLVTVPFVLLCRAGLARDGRGGRLALALGVAAIGVTTWYGPSAAVRLTAQKQIWHGAKTVAELAAGCGEQSVRAGHPVGAADFLARYSLASGLPRTTFIDVETAPSESAAGAAPDCPVAGWYEHAKDNAGAFLAVPETSDARLLAVLGLDGPPTAYEVRRHGTGYVVLRNRAD